MPRIIADGRIVHPRLGVSIPDASDTSVPRNLPAGVPIVGVDAGGAGERAGLLAPVGDALDVITAIDSVALQSYAELRTQLGKHRPGDKCALTVWRAGVTRVATVTLEGNRP